MVHYLGNTLPTATVMSYSLNPRLPRLRMEVVNHVRSGWSIRRAARHYGFEPSTVSRWVRKAPADPESVIPTRVSLPETRPTALAPDVIRAIVQLRGKHQRCAEVVHAELLQRGFEASLSSVKRTLVRQGLYRERSPWKRLHRSLPRPLAASAGELVQLDTIHIHPLVAERFYVYTLLDVFSRWAYAEVVPRISTRRSVTFVRHATAEAPFDVHMLQSDHGPEFSQHFTERILVPHRHSRVRTPNDNAHLERFNRTIQEECFRGLREDPRTYRAALGDYLRYYNGKRLHLGLELQTPLQVLRRC